jgi:hypothetical protein
VKEKSTGTVFAKLTIIIWLMCWYMACVNAVSAQCTEQITFHDCEPVTIVSEWVQDDKLGTNFWVQVMTFSTDDWVNLTASRCISHYHLSHFLWMKTCDGNPLIAYSEGYTKWWYIAAETEHATTVVMVPAKLVHPREIRGRRKDEQN